MRRYLPALAMFAALAGLCAVPGPSRSQEKKDKNPIVVIDVKDFGKFEAELYPDKAPITVKNFLQYVDEKHYDGTIFHRVMPDFMIQGGHFTKGFAKAENPQDAEK